MTVGKVVKDIFVVAAKRTPFGAYGGKLSKMTATDLLEVASRSALEAGKVDPKVVSSTVTGMVMQSSKDASGVSRHSALRVKVPQDRPAVTVNRLCGSGFQSIVTGAQEIMVGDSEVVMTGGTDNMSLMPHVTSGMRFGVKLGENVVLEDWLWQGLIDQQAKMPMGVTAENLAKKYGINREQCDQFALLSQQRWKKAHDEGKFTEEMAPITIKGKKGAETMITDEHPRPDSTMASLSKLAAVFQKDGVTTAANSSGICDGAGCVIIASAEACKKYNLTPLVRIAAYGLAGCDPTIMGIGPVPAIKSMMKAAGKSLNEVDFVEVNEAFAAQFLAVQKELGLNPDKTNVHGGAIALGHPVGASGSRIIAHLTHLMRSQKAKYAIGSACIGGGQGISILLENL